MVLGFGSLFGNTGGMGYREVGNNKSDYYTGAGPVSKTENRYIILDPTEYEVDKETIDTLLAEDALKYEGPIRDCNDRIIYMYRLKGS